jgi:hypothetical protein
MHSIEINSNDVSCCTTLRDGLLNKKIALSFGQKEESEEKCQIYSNIHHQDHYIFNLNSLDELEVQIDNANYPTRTSLDYCPYCGYGYSDNNEIQNSNFLILSNYLL